LLRTGQGEARLRGVFGTGTKTRGGAGACTIVRGTVPAITDVDKPDSVTAV